MRKKHRYEKQPRCDHPPRLTAIANAIVECFCTRTNPNPTRVFGLSIAVALVVTNPVSAATFSVTNTADSGAGSLRQAVIDANAKPGLDNIAFSSVSGSITLTSGDIDITDSVNINGPGAQMLAVDGNGASGIFGLDDVTADVLISDLTLTNAVPYAGGPYSAIDVNVSASAEVNLTVQNCVISGNDAPAIGTRGYDGAIATTIRNSVISGNTGTAIRHVFFLGNNSLIVRDSTILNNQGDGIWMNEGILTVQNTTVSGNTRVGIGIGAPFSYFLYAYIENSTISGSGRAGIDVYNGNHLTIDNSTISDNGDEGIAGTPRLIVRNTIISGNKTSGIGFDSYLFLGPIIQNSTISGNEGLGIRSFGPGVIQNSTISGNDGGIGYLTADRYYFPDIPPGVIQNSIIAGNTTATGRPDLGGGKVDIEWSLVQAPGSTVLNETFPGSNLIGVSPNLDVLQDNGGPTETHALLSGSPAINSGDPNFSTPPDFDQRGPGYPRVADGRVDMGAFELGPAQSKLAMLTTLGDINGDGVEDIAALMHNAAAGTVTATMKDAENGSLIQQISFNGSLKPVDLEVMADINANGAPEVVVLGQGTIQTQAEIRDSLTGALLGSVDFDPGVTPVDLEIVPDQDGNGIPELAVLGEGPAQVEVRNALTGNLIHTVSFTDNVTPKDLLVLPDLNGKGGREIGVLGEHDNLAHEDRVQIRDLLTGRWLRNLYYGKLNVHQVQLVPDLNNNNTPEIAVLRTSNGLVNVLIKDAVSQAHVRHIGYDPNYAPGELLVVPDVNGNGASEITVFGKNPNNHSQKATVKDGETKAHIRNVFFNKNFDPADLVVMPDINGNGASEIGMLGTRPDNGLTRLIIKDSKNGALVGTVNF